MNLQLDFIDLTKQHFRYLEDEFGFVLQSNTPPFVIYESDTLRVFVYYDAQRQCELDVGIERLSDAAKQVPTFGLGELILIDNCNEEYCSPYPSTREMLQIEVPRLAELLRKHAVKILNGDIRELGKIEKLRSEKEQEMSVALKPGNQLRG